jgi:hypothetical protein
VKAIQINFIKPSYLKKKKNSQQHEIAIEFMCSERKQIYYLSNQPFGKLTIRRLFLVNWFKQINFHGIDLENGPNFRG